jgi:hypothetical protein
VWVYERIIEELYTAFREMPKDLDLDDVETHCQTYPMMLVNVFFVRGQDGLEYANYYVDDPTPEMAKKIRCMKGQ